MELTDEERERRMRVIDDRDFTFCSVVYDIATPIEPRHPYGVGHTSYSFVVETPFKGPAMERAVAYARERWGTDPREVHLYPRNYVSDARRMAVVDQWVS